MDFSKNLVLKENYTFLVADESGQIQCGEHGLYCRDTRHLSRYAWDFGAGFQTLLSHSPRPDRYQAHYALIEDPAQAIGIRRELELAPQRLTDKLVLENSSQEIRTIELELSLAADFLDLFAVRGWFELEREAVKTKSTRHSLNFSYRGQDNLVMGARAKFSPAPQKLSDNGALFELRLNPGEHKDLQVEILLENPLDSPATVTSYENWREGFALKLDSAAKQQVLNRAIDDLRALLLFTENGPIPAAGIPWFVAAFGRDALLTAYMLLPWQSQVAEGTLRYLAALQGKKYDAFSTEAPGKIMHELRFGELSRLGKTPHRPYYGTVDATALFIIVLHELYKHSGRLDLVSELKPNWEAALQWLKNDGDIDGDGFIEFEGAEPGKGLVIQSWKDSADSMSHANGELAQGALAVSEVQAYAYAAYLATADFYQALNEADKAAQWLESAAELKAKFHEAYWLKQLQTYAMALDGKKKPLAVHNSDAGQLLWAGIVPEEFAAKLVKTLMSEELWSGWGIRTLGKSEARYNPVSYHNGSVWPHDTALIAGGLVRYGFHDEAAKIRQALYDLAASQADKRLPELIAGYNRSDAPPVPYPVACRPQAWDAAALLYLLRL